MLFTSCLLTDFLALLVTLVVILVVYIKWSFTYWDRKGVATLPVAFPFGNAAALFKRQHTFGILWYKHYEEFRKRGLRFGGSYIFTRKIFVPVEPALIKHVLQTDFVCFMNHTNYINEQVDPLSGNLLSLRDGKWKRLREKLTPTFTSGKMKMMFGTLVKCGEELHNIMEKTATNKEPLHIKELLARFTTDVIASCAFGIDSNCLRNPDAEFRKYGKMIFEFDKPQLWKFLAQFSFSHKILAWFNFKFTKDTVEDFMMELVKSTVNYREKNNVFRKDFMHLLIQLKNMGKVTDDGAVTEGQVGEVGLTINEVAAQAFIFFAAGFETSSTTMTFVLYELAMNKEIQRRVRQEIREVLKKYNNELTYEAAMEMKYLEQVIQETLRKYPPVPFLHRTCTKDFKVPETDVIVEKDTLAMVPILGLHRDEEYFPNPEVFDPERFNKENRSKIKPFTYLPFGDGPRVCIGMRFGMMQTKVGLVTILKDYELSINKRTEVPIKFDPLSFFLSAEGNIYLDVVKYL